MNIANVNVSRNSEYSDYALSWEHKDARYHVWLSAPRLDLRPELFKNPVEPRNRHEPGYFATRHLSILVPKNKLMIDAALAEAEAGDLFAKCDAALAQQEEKRKAENAAAYKVKLAEEAGPQMLEALKELVAAIQDGLRRHAAGDPNAIASDMIGATTRQAEAAILQAETGGAVQL